MFQYLLCPLFCVTCRTTFLERWLKHDESGELHSDASATYVIYYWLLLIMNEVGRIVKRNVQAKFPKALSEFYNLSGDGRVTPGIWTCKLEIHRYLILFFCKNGLIVVDYEVVSIFPRNSQ